MTCGNVKCRRRFKTTSRNCAECGFRCPHCKKVTAKQVVHG